jgi:hypothetical protein
LFFQNTEQQNPTSIKSPNGHVLSPSANNRVLSPSRANNNISSSNKDIHLRENTYNFIQKISAFVNSLSKNNNQQIDFELKTIFYSWNSLCDIYESYPNVTNKTKKVHEIVEELDQKLTVMIEELKLNHLDKVISIALDLAHNAKKLFCRILNNYGKTSVNNDGNGLTMAISGSD